MKLSSILFTALLANTAFASVLDQPFFVSLQNYYASVPENKPFFTGVTQIGTFFESAPNALMPVGMGVRMNDHTGYGLLFANVGWHTIFPSYPRAIVNLDVGLGNRLAADGSTGFVVSGQTDGYLGQFSWHTTHLLRKRSGRYVSEFNQLLFGSSFWHQRLEIAIGPEWGRNPNTNVSYLSRLPVVAAEYSVPFFDSARQQAWLSVFARAGGGYAASTGLLPQSQQWLVGLSMQYRLSRYAIHSAQHKALEPVATVFHFVPTTITS